MSLEYFTREFGRHPLLDTAKACIDRNESTALYLGGGKPHFPVPAIKYVNTSEGMTDWNRLEWWRQ